MQWHQLDHMQTICTSHQRDNHTNTWSLNFYRMDDVPGAKPTVSKRRMTLPQLSNHSLEWSDSLHRQFHAWWTDTVDRCLCWSRARVAHWPAMLVHQDTFTQHKALLNTSHNVQHMKTATLTTAKYLTRYSRMIHRDSAPCFDRQRH